jgi:hypothetical protein
VFALKVKGINQTKGKGISIITSYVLNEINHSFLMFRFHIILDIKENDLTNLSMMR